MENNEILEPMGGDPGITLNNEAKAYLKEAGKWAGFLGIVGFVFCAIILIFSFFAGTILSRAALTSPSPFAASAAGFGGFITVFYLVIDLFYFFFSLYLYQFGDRIKKGLMFTDNLHVTAAFGKLKSFFKLWGITTIVVICLYALVFVGIMIFAIVVAAHK
jgi:hypothetical protein